MNKECPEGLALTMRAAVLALALYSRLSSRLNNNNTHFHHVPAVVDGVGSGGFRGLLCYRWRREETIMPRQRMIWCDTQGKKVFRSISHLNFM